MMNMNKFDFLTEDEWDDFFDPEEGEAKADTEKEFSVYTYFEGSRKPWTACWKDERNEAHEADFQTEEQAMYFLETGEETNEISEIPEEYLNEYGYDAVELDAWDYEYGIFVW